MILQESLTLKGGNMIDFLKNAGEIWAVVIAVASIIIKFIIPKLKEDNKFLPIVKWIANWIALNR